MAELGKYFIFSSLLFLLVMICDIIFYTTYSACGISSNAAPIFLILTMLNAIIFFLMFVDGLLINHFSDQDPADLRNLGLIKKVLGIITKFLPTLVKLLHLFKVFIFFILTILTVVAITGKLTVTDVTTCSETKLEVAIVDGYKSQIIIFFGIEAFSICFALCILGTIRSFMNEDGYLFSPQPPDTGCFRRYFFKVFGP